MTGYVPLSDRRHRAHAKLLDAVGTGKRVLDTMYVSQDRAVLALQLLLEGNSIRSTERITKLDRNTIMRLLVLAGERCQALMNSSIAEATHFGKWLGPCRFISGERHGPLGAKMLHTPNEGVVPMRMASRAF